MQKKIESIARALKGKKRVLIATHVNPDGDAIGSATALSHVALHMGAETRIFLVTGLPDFLSWLPIPCPYVTTLAGLDEWTPDLLAVVDCGDAKRTGPELEALLTKGIPPESARGSGWDKVESINIDHHLSNPEFATHNWVEPKRAATGELVGMLAEHLGIALTGDLAMAVYLALVADTGNFTYSNSGPECFAMAARIIGGGLDIAAFTSRYENTWSIGRMHLWGRLMSEVTLHMNGAVACSVVPKKYLDESGLRKSDLDGFAAVLRRLRGVRVGLFVREDAPGLCKISLRTMGDVDVSTVAALFGGGGHAAAAGAEVSLPPDEAAKIILEELAKVL